MLTDDLIGALRCPLCAAPLARAETALRCPAAHSFDLSRHGYAHLGTGRKLPEGDTPAMVAARTRTLPTLYGPLAEAVDHELMDVFGGVFPPWHRDQQSEGAPLVVDLGAGTGFYLARVLEGWGEAGGLAFDVSKAALRQAAKAHPRAGAVLADTWGTLPLADGCADLVLNVFAPRNGDEMRRVLGDGGLLLVATPTGDHLGELRAALPLLKVDEAKERRLPASLPQFRQTGARTVRWTMDLSREQALDLVGMGPSAHHVDLSGLGGQLPDRMEVTAGVFLSTWTGRPLPSRPAGRGTRR
ncbi:methyltransferase domain-containing protein [Catellatospora sp. KI3]|uniref:putative RNA methyltransferase n=1 Tax=Catellatospora sp. KI3 TaxID=3041620 RepID=UPI00248215E4|nr:methyltransferase domain-containing protein [Catellatospora sp. KI3]MDI1459966.1 methyltransferase domain-containing protein [Catellatospora sp. KI3]